MLTSGGMQLIANYLVPVGATTLTRDQIDDSLVIMVDGLSEYQAARVYDLLRKRRNMDVDRAAAIIRRGP